MRIVNTIILVLIINAAASPALGQPVFISQNRINAFYQTGKAAFETRKYVVAFEYLSVFVLLMEKHQDRSNNLDRKFIEVFNKLQDCLYKADMWTGEEHSKEDFFYGIGGGVGPPGFYDFNLRFKWRNDGIYIDYQEINRLYFKAKLALEYNDRIFALKLLFAYKILAEDIFPRRPDFLTSTEKEIDLIEKDLLRALKTLDCPIN